MRPPYHPRTRRAKTNSVPYDIRFAVGKRDITWTRYYDKELPFNQVVEKCRDVLRIEYGSTYILLSVIAQPTQEDK